ncbi:2470_t:CDS:2 [Funneliformis geosporum]|nr:2470_t:CDS:2 [Funneliformis geosporum]
MEYANNGNLRKNLPKIIKYNWYHKLLLLIDIISGLNEIHNLKLVHQDFHDGNILNCGTLVYISDLGLCRSVESSYNKNEIYGVLPFIAPEVLRYKPYTSASDIYSFSMIMWEFISGIPPFKDRVHDRQLYLSICNGERPEIIENAPQCYINLMKKCWNEDPLKRPNAFEIIKIFRDWIKNKNDIDDFYDCPPKNRYSINNID